MNNIYKVIWSKAKNCYVVASEIARSHTKSASGSEKIGGVTRRSLLASLMALSLLCGGLGVASAVDVVHVDESASGGIAGVYTTTKVDTELGKKADKTAVDEIKNTVGGEDSGLVKKTNDNATAIEVNRTNINALKDTVGDDTKGLTKKINDNATAINTLTTNVNVKADATTVNDISTRVDKLETTVGNDASGLVKDVAEAKTDITNIKNTIGDDTAGLIKKVNDKANASDVYSKTDAENKFADKKTTENALATKANQSELDTATGRITAVEKKTTRINYDAANDKTTINGVGISNTQVDMGGKDITNAGALTATGKVTGNGVDAGDGAITTAGAVNAGSLTVTDASTLKGDVIMNQKLNVTGDTSLNKTDVNGALTAKGDVTLGTPNGTNTVTVNGIANFHEKVNMNNGLNVTNGETNLKDTTVTGDLKVTGTITTDKMVFGDPTTNNYTEIDHGKVTSTNLEVRAGQAISSSSTFDVEKNEVGFGNGITGEQSFHKQTSDVIMDNVKDGKNSNNRTQTKTETKDIITDENGNSSTTSQTASENKTYLKDKDGKNTNSTVDTAKGYDKTIKGENGETSTKQDELNITNTAKDGTITNDANHIENKANTMDTNVTGKATESYGELETTVNGQATENFKGGLNTTVTGAENHTVTGKQINTVGDGQINNITGGQTNNILTGDQKTTVSDGSIINKAENGDISNTAKNVTNEGTVSVTNKVGTNEVKVSKDGVDINVDADKTIKESVGADTSRTMTDGNIIDKAGDMTVTTNKTTGTTFENGTRNDTTVINGGTIGTNKVNANETNTKKLTAGAAADADGGRLTVDANDGVKGSYKYGDYTSRSYILANTLQSGVDNDKEPIDADFVGSRTDHYMDGDKAKLDETVKDADGSNVTNKTSTGTVTTITDGTTTTTTEQGVKDITNTATGGTITNTAKDIVNNAQDTITNTAGTSITNQVKDSTVTTDANGTTFENKTAAVSDGGTTTTKINGNRINTGRVDANELGVSDKDDQGNTADFSVKAGEGIKGSATDKDGNKTYTKVTATENSFQVQDKDGNIKNHQVNTKDSSENTITNGDKTNTVTSTADGTTFNNSKAATPVTGASGEGNAVNTTIKGNTITTGKVTMDYADVMKDLGVRGNANITGKTTTGSLEVTGTSTLKGDVTMESNATVEKDINVKGTTTTKTLKVTENATVGGTLDVAKKATFQDSVDIAKDLSVGGDVTAKSYKVGDKTYISADGINANDQKITNVADGSISEGSKDAVNGGQLYGMKTDLEHKVDKVGANAAAMANLHPMEFDPDSKWNIAAAMGNYGSETATAIGAFYRPNEDVMVNFSTAFGTGENMVGGGVSVRLGKGSNKLSRQESNALKAQVNDLTARMDALLSVLNPNMSKDFPDVPENHWAYEAVSRLAGNDIVQGYPDGEFHGDRTMTRYEMAEIIYNALSRGAEAERELVEEFKPELQAMAASEKATAERAEG